MRISKPLVLSGIRGQALDHTPEILESLPLLGFASCVITNSETPARKLPLGGQLIYEGGAWTSHEGLVK